MPLDLPKPTEVAVPLFIVFLLLEIFYGWKTGRINFEGKDALTSMFMGLISGVAGLVGVFVLGGISLLVWDARLFDLGTDPWVFVVAFIVVDFAYYWIHRYGHRMRWMWAAHVVHHSSQHYNLTTALRQTWTGFLTPGFLFYLPLFFLGLHPAIVAFCYGINLVYQFWIHTEAINKCPRWFEYIFNTPSHHRVHHSNNPRYLDANYSGVFMAWDRMFGSFVPETDEEKCNYGLVTDLGTFNPLRVAFHEWVGIFKDIATAKTWRARVLFLIAPPGWTPDGSRMTSDMIRAAWIARTDAKGEASKRAAE
ncbi:MAG: C-5 sterol desaturase [Kordiimonadales bacterium]|nr:MAG: C-5 sterol desaturase [Kordiimonadales bacterium]